MLSTILSVFIILVEEQDPFDLHNIYIHFNGGGKVALYRYTQTSFPHGCLAGNRKNACQRPLDILSRTERNLGILLFV